MRVSIALRDLAFAGWVSIVYHTELKDDWHWFPSHVEGIYYNWNTCSQVYNRLQHHRDEVGEFQMMCFQQVWQADAWIAQQDGYSRYRQSDACSLDRDPTAEEINRFFLHDNLLDFKSRLETARRWACSEGGP